MDIFVVALLLGAGSVAWLFYRKSSRVAPIANQPPLRLQGNGTYEFAVLGVSHYRPALEKLCDVDQRDPKTVDALLVPEDTNARDENAVRVEIRGRTVGYLPPDLSEAYRKRLVESGYPGARGICKARLIVRMHSSMGGHADYSVRLDLPRRRNGK